MKSSLYSEIETFIPIYDMRERQKTDGFLIIISVFVGVSQIIKTPVLLG